MSITGFKNMQWLWCIMLLLFGYSAGAQATWAATSSPVMNDRYDDIYFINADTGWVLYN